MTKKELSQIYYLSNEIDMWRKELNRLQTMSLIPSQEITGMPFSPGGKSDKTGNLASKKADIRAKIAELQGKLIEEYSKLMNYIETIDDSIIRQIIYHRCILCMQWGQVARHVGGGNSADGLRKMLDRFLDDKEEK